MNKRYEILILSGIALFTFYFAYDIPAALNHSLEFENSANKPSKITTLYSAYAAPNIIVPLFFSYIQKLSKSSLAIILAGFVLTGHSIFSYGVSIRSFKTMILGRILFGIGGESFSAIQTKILIDHFKGKELALAMGVFSGIGRLGTVCNFILTPLIAAYFGCMPSCILGIILSAIGFALSFKIYKLNENCSLNELKVESLRILSKIVKLNFNETSERSILENNKNENITNSAIYNQMPFHTQNIPSDIQTSIPAMKVKQFNSSFRMIVMISFLFGIVWAPFYNIAPMMFQSRFGVNSVISSRMLGCIEFISILLVAIISSLVDSHGFALMYIMLGGVVLFAVHLLIYLKAVNSVICVVMLGVASPLIACYWPCIPKIISGENLSKGFAIIYCMLNLAYTFSPLLVAYLVAKDPLYNYIEIYILYITAIALFCILYLQYKNYRNVLGLNDKENILEN